MLAPSCSLSLASRISRDDIRPTANPSAAKCQRQLRTSWYSSYVHRFHALHSLFPAENCTLSASLSFTRHTTQKLILHRFINLLIVLRSFLYHAIVQVLASDVKTVWGVCLAHRAVKSLIRVRANEYKLRVSH